MICRFCGHECKKDGHQANGREREDRRRHVPLHAGLHLAGNGRKEWLLQPGGNVRSSGQRGNSHSRSGGNGAVEGEIPPAGRHLQTGGCLRYAGAPGHRRTAQPWSGHSGLLSDRLDTTPDTPADDTAQSGTTTAYRRAGSGTGRVTRRRFRKFTGKVHNIIRTFCQAAKKSRRDSADSDL